MYGHTCMIREERCCVQHTREKARERIVPEKSETKMIAEKRREKRSYQRKNVRKDHTTTKAREEIIPEKGRYNQTPYVAKRRRVQLVRKRLTTYLCMPERLKKLCWTLFLTMSHE